MGRARPYFTTAMRGQPSLKAEPIRPFPGSLTNFATGPYPDGRLRIRHNGVDLPDRTFDKLQQVNQAAVVENKRLGPVLTYIAEQQKDCEMRRSKKAPRRQGQRHHMFEAG